MQTGCGLEISKGWPGTVHCGLRLGVSICSRGPGTQGALRNLCYQQGSKGRSEAGTAGWLSTLFPRHFTKQAVANLPKIPADTPKTTSARSRFPYTVRSSVFTETAGFSSQP